MCSRFTPSDFFASTPSHFSGPYFSIFLGHTSHFSAAILLTFSQLYDMYVQLRDPKRGIRVKVRGPITKRVKTFRGECTRCLCRLILSVCLSFFTSAVHLILLSHSSPPGSELVGWLRAVQNVPVTDASKIAQSVRVRSCVCVCSIC